MPPELYPILRMSAFAGGPGEDSFLKYLDDDDNVLTFVGAKGENGGTDGGAGYSGGGGYGGSADYQGGNGGAAGSNGQDGTAPDAPCCSPGDGGAGSSLDVTTIRLRNFELSAGKGGQVNGYFYGGGAGGVKVDGSSPDAGGCRPDDNGQCLDGEGYGAGSYTGRDGLPGLVLLDFCVNYCD